MIRHSKLVKELIVILIVKVVLLVMIKSIWFDRPTVPPDGEQQMNQHLFNPRPSTSSPAEESSK